MNDLDAELDRLPPPVQGNAAPPETLSVSSAPVVSSTSLEDDDMRLKFARTHQIASEDVAAREAEGVFFLGDVVDEVVKNTWEPVHQALNDAAEATGLNTLADGLKGTAKDALQMGADVVVKAPLKGVRDLAQSVLSPVDQVGTELAKWYHGGELPDNIKDLGPFRLPDVTQPENPDEEPGRWDLPFSPIKTLAGKIAKNVVQFLLPFKAAAALPGIRALVAAGKTSKTAAIAAGMAQGAVADFVAFEGHEERLSNLLIQYEIFRNPVTEWLAAKPEDSEALGRFKNAVEGLGLGIITDAFVAGVTAIKNARVARTAAAAPEQAAKAEAKAVSDAGDAAAGKEQLSTVLGDPDSPELFITKGQKKIDDAAKAAGDMNPMDVLQPPPSTGEEIFINWARIDAPDQIRRAIDTMAQKDKSTIELMRRGKRTWEQTTEAAGKEDAWKLISDRMPKDVFNAEQAVAARQLWAASGDALTQAAKLAAQSPSDANVFAFRKMLATHYAIQREVLAARTEAARALNAWKIPAGGKQQMDALKAILDANGGRDVSEKLAKDIKQMTEAGLHREVEALVEGGFWAKSLDALSQFRYASLLSNPTTHVANQMSGLVSAVQQIYERATAARLGKMLGTDGAVELGEATEMAFGMIEGFKEALIALRKSGGSTLLPDGVSEALKMGAKESEKELGKFSPEVWKVSRSNPLGWSLMFMDFTTNIPGRMLQVGDELWKGVGYRGEIRAQAMRRGVRKVRAGEIAAKDLKKYVADLVANPDEEMKAIGVESALYNTFTQKPDEILNKLGSGIQAVPVLGRLLLPFKNTPINILTYVSERSPLAPLVAEWRADFRAGGAKADLAMARVATGSFTMLAAVDLALSGVITGAGPSGDGSKASLLKRQGWQPYSIRIGKRWYSFARTDPLGMTLGLAADIAETAANASEAEDKSFEELFIGSILAVSKNVTSKTYMKGVSDFFAAVADPDRAGEKWFQSLSGSMVPAVVGHVSRQFDPELKTVQSMADAMRNKIYLGAEPKSKQSDILRGRATLALSRDLWGRTIDYRSPWGKEGGWFGKAFDLLSPITVRASEVEDIDGELERIKHYPKAAGKRVLFHGIAVDLSQFPHLYSRYQQLAGEPALTFLNKEIKESSYQRRPDDPDKNGSKADFVDFTLNRFREQAREQLFKESSELRIHVHAKRMQEKEKRSR